MAAYVVKLTEEEWAVLSSITARLEDGGIVVPPDVAKKFEEETGKEIPDGALIDYDFGGDPDVWLDILGETDSYQASAIKRHLDLDDEEPKT